MATLRDIRRRIKAVKNTSQITKAMKMVAAAKLRRTQGRMLDMRPYADKMYEVITTLGRLGDVELHPLLAKRPRGKVEVLVITSDRGLCGAFNTNILRAANNHVKELEAESFKVSISAVGRKAGDYYRRRSIPLRSHWAGLSGKIRYQHAQEIAASLSEGYIGGTFDEVLLIYNEFKSVIAQKVVVKRLLPFASPESGQPHSDTLEMPGFTFEPEASAVYASLIPKAVEIEIYRALLESQTSEEAARMSAMENASKSAEEMIQRLTLVANKVRQATITRELMDIVGGVEALK